MPLSLFTPQRQGWALWHTELHLDTAECFKITFTALKKECVHYIVCTCTSVKVKKPLHFNTSGAESSPESGMFRIVLVIYCFC